MTLFLFLGFQCSHPFGGCKLYYPQITTGWSCLPLHSRCSQLTDPFGWSCGGPKWTNNGKPSETVEESQIIYRILIRRNIYSKMLHSCVLFLDHVVVFFIMCSLQPMLRLNKTPNSTSGKKIGSIYYWFFHSFILHPLFYQYTNHDSPLLTNHKLCFFHGGNIMVAIDD